MLDRYLVEIVEAYDLCPWARGARLSGELAIDIVAGTPALDRWTAAATALLAQPATRVAMVVAPELACTAAELRAVRGEVAARLRTAGIAEFHPDASFDDGSPARLVSFLRRAPYPMLQLVPLAILDHVRGARPAAGLAAQAQMLRGSAPPPREDVAARIAAANHACVIARRAEFDAALAAIFADRDASTSR